MVRFGLTTSHSGKSFQVGQVKLIGCRRFVMPAKEKSTQIRIPGWFLRACRTVLGRLESGFA
jgi:hypothetical protein